MEVYNPDIVALQDTMYAIGGKWKIPIIKSICSGNIHFKEIERSIPGITKRSLSKELKELELNQFITRMAYEDTPSKAEYRFTQYAKSLIPLIEEMVSWGREHRRRILTKSHTLA
jgi:DNA-binding HxlR family transcriptional regulator